MNNARFARLEPEAVVAGAEVGAIAGALDGSGDGGNGARVGDDRIVINNIQIEHRARKLEKATRRGFIINEIKSAIGNRAVAMQLGNQLQGYSIGLLRGEGKIAELENALDRTATEKFHGLNQAQSAIVRPYLDTPWNIFKCVSIVQQKNRQ